MEVTEDLLERVWPHAYRIAFAILQNKAAAEDAAQEACASVYSSIDQLRDEGSFDRWFYRIVVRCAYRLVDDRRLLPLDIGLTLSHRDEIVESLALRTAIDRLPVTQRLPIIFHYFYGFGDAEIAKILGTTHIAIRVRLFAARQALRKALRVQCNSEKGCVLNSAD